uniref:Elongation of very long chain fatty acids protein n=1 Tax=Sus scrofa TaxID=9823 RepID=A0A8D0QMR8_PIG
RPVATALIRPLAWETPYAVEWLKKWKKSFLVSALYAAFIFGGRHVMNKRAKFELRKPLVLWSLSLAVFRCQNLPTALTKAPALFVFGLSGLQGDQ